MHQFRLLSFDAASDFSLPGHRRKGAPPFHRYLKLLTNGTNPDHIASHGITVIFLHSEFQPAFFKIRAGKLKYRNLNLPFFRSDGSFRITICRQSDADRLLIFSRVENNLLFLYGEDGRFFPSCRRQEFLHDHISGPALHKTVVHGVLLRQILQKYSGKIREEEQLHGFLPILMIQPHKVFHPADAPDGGVGHDRRHNHTIRDIIFASVGNQKEISLKLVA